jgi:hypothetical protein
MGLVPSRASASAFSELAAKTRLRTLRTAASTTGLTVRG